MSERLDMTTLQPRCGKDRRGIALIMVMMVVSSLLIIGVLFAGSVTAEYRAAVYYRQAIQSEQYCVVGLHRAMAEMMYDVWGVNENLPFRSARPNPDSGQTDSMGNPGDFDPSDPNTALLPLTDAAYYETGSGALTKILRQKGMWNGQAWVVWGGDSAATGDVAKVTPPAAFANPWLLDARPFPQPELVGGAQEYLSYGRVGGTVTCTNGSTAVTGTDTDFDTAWTAGTAIWINGVAYAIASVTNTTTLTLQAAFAEISAAGLSWFVSGSYNCPASLGSPPLFTGGTQSVSDFVATGRGYAADPRWINPAKFICYRPAAIGAAWVHGGVDIDGDGSIDAKDKALRDWALWQLRRDAFLPESADNHDLFQPSLHANNRRLWENSVTLGGVKYDAGWEFVDPKIVGDSFYLVFRSDPIYSLASNVSADPTWASGLGQPLDGSSNPAAGLRDGRTDQAGFRYPYDRTHLGKSATVAWDRDACGGLANVNDCNNDFNIEQLTSVPSGPPQNWTWYHYPESKHIYCYDPLDEKRTYGRYALMVMPDCGTWNAAALHSGEITPANSGTYWYVTGAGRVAAAGGFLSALYDGFNPKTGDDASGQLLQANAYSMSPIRPSPLPGYWFNQLTDNGGSPYCIDGQPDVGQTGAMFPSVDYSRAYECAGGHGGSFPWWGGTGGIRSAIFTYLCWLGPYDSRAEFATHLRKGSLVVHNPGYPGYPNNLGLLGPDNRRCMEERDVSQSAYDKIASDARVLASLTTVQGYYYTLDRFWDRDLLLIDWGAGTSGTAAAPGDMRFATAQCERDTATTFADAAARPGQLTRRRYIQMMRDLETYGGYRTRDGKYKLMEYLFDVDAAAYNPDAPPAGAMPAPTLGGPGTLADPTTWSVQRKASRMEKNIAMSTSRLGCMQRGGSTYTAACSRGHLVHNPRLTPFYRSRFDGATGKKIFNELRTSPADLTLDDLGEGCPVCGGKLFLSQVHETNISEIGRFFEKFKTAERPVREAWELDAVRNPGQAHDVKPARHFVELMGFGYTPDSSAVNSTLDSYVRFQGLWWSGTEQAWMGYPGTLSDPITRMPYFTHGYDLDMRFRMASTRTEAMNPEPTFRQTGDWAQGGGSSEMRLLVWDDTDQGGRWHDVTWYMDYGQNCVRGGSYFGRWPHVDPALYNGAIHKFVVDDSSSSTASWSLRNITADEKYAMASPDPAHQQECESRGFQAAVSIYRKMPVRWYGGKRKQTYDIEYGRKASYPDPLGPWSASGGGPATPDNPLRQPSRVGYARGLGFSSHQRLRFTWTNDGMGGTDVAYRGNYDAATNPDGWPGPTSRGATNLFQPSSVYGWTANNLEQYAVISFDARFDGTKVALCQYGSSNSRPNYDESYRIIDYVELTDSAGSPVRISQACRPEGNTMLSWQVRNPLDRRSNADGYMLWDLLPMTLQNADIDGVTAGRAPTSNTLGYDPWNSDANYKWWGNADDGFFAGQSDNSAQPRPPGYSDLTSMTCNLRNSNIYIRDIPVRRKGFDGTTATAGNSMEARAELATFRIDHCTEYGTYRSPNRKECLASTATGIGRQNDTASSANPALTATYSGRQHTVLPGMTWQEGSGSADPRQKWAGYSWDNWYDLFYVSDLCQQMLLNNQLTAEDRDIFDGDQDGERDERTDASLAYDWNGGTVSAIPGHYSGEIKQINKLNLNELWYPPTFAGTGWHTQWYGNSSSYTSFGRKPLKGFHAASDCFTYNFGAYSSGNPEYNSRVKPWDLYDDFSEDFFGRIPSSSSSDFSPQPARHYQRLDSSHTGNSAVYTVFVTGNALDEAGEPLAEMRARVTVERTWDGRMSILEFTWLPTDRGFME